jgi:hypothetical protein
MQPSRNIVANQHNPLRSVVTGARPRNHHDHKTQCRRLYSRKKNPKTGERGNLGTFKTRQATVKHERAVQYFKRH